MAGNDYEIPPAPKKIPAGLFTSTSGRGIDAFHVHMTNGRLQIIVGTLDVVSRGWSKALADGELWHCESPVGVGDALEDLLLNPAEVSEIGFATTEQRKRAREMGRVGS